MARTGALLAHAVPNVAVEVVVAGEEQTAGLAERDGGDAADDVVVRVHGQLLVGPHVEQSARRIVRPRRKRLPVREKLKHKQTHCSFDDAQIFCIVYFIYSTLLA